MSANPAPTSSRDNLSARLRMTWRLTGAGLIIMVALIAYSAFEYLHLQKEVDAKRQELQTVNQSLESKRKIVDLLATLKPGEYEQLLAVANQQSAEQNTAAAPLASVILPKAKATAVPGVKTSAGDQVYDFQLWIDVPGARKAEIQSVAYLLDDPSMRNKRPSSSDPSNGFAVGYRGWGAFHLVTITINLRQGPPLTLYFDMIKALGWE